MDDKPDRESVLVQLRRERGLTSGGEYRLPLINLNQLMLQSGLTIGLGTADRCSSASASSLAFAAHRGVRRATSCTRCWPRCFAAWCCRSWCCEFLRWRRQKKFGAQFPDAIDIIVR